MVTRVAACQLPFAYLNTPQEFADHVRMPVQVAAQNGAQIILLPHLASFMLYGMFDFDSLPTDTLEQLAARQKLETREWLSERAGYVFEFHLHLFQSLAARFECWLAPGTVLEPDGDARYLTAFLLNPAGEIVGRQRQMHRTASEIAWGVSQGDTLRVLETEIGDFGFVIGEDVRYPETARALALNGATALLHPAAFQTAAELPPPALDEQFLTDIWRDVQSNQTFGVQAALCGGNHRGRSAVYAPVEMTGDKRGILAQATTDTSGEIVLATLDFDALRRVRAEYPILDLLNRTAYGNLSERQD